jgi:hypothetical protein
LIFPLKNVSDSDTGRSLRSKNFFVASTSIVILISSASNPSAWRPKQPPTPLIAELCYRVPSRRTEAAVASLVRTFKNQVKLACKEYRAKRRELESHLARLDREYGAILGMGDGAVPRGRRKPAVLYLAEVEPSSDPSAARARRLANGS